MVNLENIHAIGFYSQTLFCIILQYAFILILYSRNVNKFGLVIALIIGVGAMLVIPTPIGRVAKASTCTFVGSNHGLTLSGSGSASGSCSIAAGISQGAARGGGLFSKSSCSSASASSVSSDFKSSGSNGAVSCSSHSP